MRRTVPSAQPLCHSDLRRAVHQPATRFNALSISSPLHAHAHAPRAAVVRWRQWAALKAAEDEETVVERRAADVLVIGSGAVAAATAYSLARRGKKVIHLYSFGIEARTPAAAAPQRALHVPSPTAELASAAEESSAYWRGLQSLSAGGAPLLDERPTLDVGSGASGAPSAEQLARIRDACAAAGVPLSALTPSEVAALFPSLQLPPSFEGLLHRQGGGVLDPAAAPQLLASLATRAGAAVRERLILRGWSDRGSSFQVRASSALLPGAVSLLEAEQLLLAPGRWLPQCLSLFGVRVGGGMRLAEQQRVRLSSTSSTTASMPLWRYHGGGGGAVEADGQMGQAAPCAGLPSTSTDASSGHLTLWLPPLGQAFSPSSTDSTRPQDKERQETQPLLSPFTWVPSAEAAAARAAAGHCSRFVRSLGGMQSSGLVSDVVLVAPEDAGLPAYAGCLPGVEEGRLYAAAVATQGGGVLDAYGLSPWLAKAAADMVESGGQPSGRGLLERLAWQQRQGVEVAAERPAVDTWRELGRALKPPPVEPTGSGEDAGEGAEIKGMKAKRGPRGSRQY